MGVALDQVAQPLGNQECAVKRDQADQGQGQCEPLAEGQAGHDIGTIDHPVHRDLEVGKEDLIGNSWPAIGVGRCRFWMGQIAGRHQSQGPTERMARDVEGGIGMVVKGCLDVFMNACKGFEKARVNPAPLWGEFQPHLGVSFDVLNRVGLSAPEGKNQHRRLFFRAFELGEKGLGAASSAVECL